MKAGLTLASVLRKESNTIPPACVRMHALLYRADAHVGFEAAVSLGASVLFPGTKKYWNEPLFEEVCSIRTSVCHCESLLAHL